MTTLKRTPLFPLYDKHGARVIDFGGWELPVQFSGIQAEHEAVRTRAGLFDVSHMGEVNIAGKDSLAFLQKVTTNDVSKLVPGQAQYSLMCYPDGGVVDDLLVYYIEGDRYMLVINASNIDKDLDWLRSNKEGDVTIEDISEQTALLAIQGPKAASVLGKLTNEPIADLQPFRFLFDAKVDGVSAIVSRTGYTGEDGFELYVDGAAASALWEKLLEAGAEEGILPIGLGARDTLRFEARLPLYGQELSASITPIEAGVGFFVKPDKGEFNGRSVLAEQKKNGAPRKLVGIEMIDRGIPRSHYPVFADGKQIGEVTTGTQSPTLKTNVGLALIDKAYAELGTELFVEIRGKQLRAKVVKTPFYAKSK
ncbi:glycine cleavage system aminomethyltransferase GcvT [Paenibacillus sp. MBLB4367]|uniref:glycine cleavage system aminomethyltransferase GcvT n=1 Tax=Paenibacillus sp. MBLB4367 TaxID=3384767 RepID=UPI003908316A